MSTPALPFGNAPAGRTVRLAMLAAWLAAAGFLIAHHVMWRDEVRALTLALNGGGTIAMLRGIAGEGHPALWYLLLRGAHEAVAVPQVLPGVAAVVGASCAALVALRAPFRAATLALILFGAFFLFEYTVSARNYGVSMLCLFAAAALPMRRGVLVGLVLAALCNTNVGAVLLAGAFLLFRGVDLVTTQSLRAGPERRALLTATAITSLGILLCFVTVYPPVNDAAVPLRSDSVGVVALIGALFAPAKALYSLAPAALGDGPAAALLLTALLVGGPLSLIRTPGGFFAAIAGLFAFALFHGLLYPGSYRHHALYLALIVALHWMAASGAGGRWPARFAPSSGDRLALWGQRLFVALLALQMPASATALVRAARGGVFSQSRDLAALLERPGLRDAVVIAEPDYMIEPLAYYAPNHPVWLIRERRWGRTVRYIRAVRRSLSLGDVLAEAVALRARVRRPVVIVIEDRLDPTVPPQELSHGYVTTFATSPRQIRAFQAATRRLARFEGAESDENYEVYLLAG